MDRRDEASASLNKLLNEELSAVETYKQALDNLDSVENEEAAAELRRIEEDHERVVTELRESLRAHGGVPEATPRLWIGLEAVSEIRREAYDVESMLQALKEGEQRGMKEYEDVLQDKDTDPICRQVVRERLIPRQQNHIAAIEQCLRTLH